MDDLKKYKDKLARWSDKREGGRSTGSRQDREGEDEAASSSLPEAQLSSSSQPLPSSQPSSDSTPSSSSLSVELSSPPTSSDPSSQITSNPSEIQIPVSRRRSSTAADLYAASLSSSQMSSQPASSAISTATAAQQAFASAANASRSQPRPPPPAPRPALHPTPSQIPFAVPVPDPTPAKEMLAKLKDQAKDAQNKIKQELDSHRDSVSQPGVPSKTSWYKRFSRPSTSNNSSSSASPDRSSLLFAPETESNNNSRGSVTSSPRTPTHASLRTSTPASTSATPPAPPVIPPRVLTPEEAEELAQQMDVFQGILDAPEKFGKYLKFLDQRQQQELLFICEVDQLLNRMPTLSGIEVDQQAQKISKIYLHPTSPMAIRSVSSDTARRLEGNLRQSEEARANHDAMVNLAQKNALVGNRTKTSQTDIDGVPPIPAETNASGEPLAIVVHLPPGSGASSAPNPDATPAPSTGITVSVPGATADSKPDEASSNGTNSASSVTPVIAPLSPNNSAGKTPMTPTGGKYSAEAFGFIATTMSLLKQAKSQVSEALIRQSLRAFVDYESGKTSESGKLESFEFDDVQRDSTCFRSFLLFLVEDRRYRLLLFWKDVQEASLDKLLIRSADVFEKTEEIYYTICASSSSVAPSPAVFSARRSSSSVTIGSPTPSNRGKSAARGKNTGQPVPPEILLARLRVACNALEDIYDRYVGRWQLQSQNSDDLPTLCYSYTNADLATLVPQIRTLVGRLQPFYKKVDRLLRFTLWPQFCKSSYYPSLMELRKQKLQSEQSRRNLLGNRSLTASDFRDITRSLVSFLKQQPVTRDSLVLDCRVYDESEQPCPKSLSKQQMLAHTSNLRLLEYVCVFRCRTVTGLPSTAVSRSSSINLVQRYPPTDHDDVKLPEHLADFCFPDNGDTSKLCVCGSKMRRRPKARDGWGFADAAGEEELLEQGDEIPVDRMFNFVLITLSGQRLYGACLQYSLPDEVVADELEPSQSRRSSASVLTSSTVTNPSTPIPSSSLPIPPSESKEPSRSRSSEGNSEDEEIEMSINAFLASPRLPDEPVEEPVPEERTVKQVVAVCVLSAIPLVQQLREALTTLLPSIYPVTETSEKPNHFASPSPSPSLSPRSTPAAASFVPSPLPSSSSLSPLAARAGMAPEALVSTAPFMQLELCTEPNPDDIFGVQDAALQVPFCDFSLDLLFRALSPNAVLAVLEALLMEKKILLISAQLTTLTVVAESLRTLLYPFDWHYLYIPILPLTMFQYLACPTPFLMGIHSCFREKAGALLGDSSEDVVRVDLDQNSVSSAHSAERLPEVCRRRLSDSIQQLFFQTLQRVDSFSTVPAREDPFFLELSTAGSSPPRQLDPLHRLSGSSVSDVMSRSQQLRMEFLKMWAHMLRDYRHFCLHIPDVAEPALLFDHAGFVASKEGSQDNYAPFLKCLMHTSHVPAFLHERSHAKGLTRINKDAFDRYEATCSRARASKRDHGRDVTINDPKALQGWAPPLKSKNSSSSKHAKLGSPLLRLLKNAAQQPVDTLRLRRAPNPEPVAVSERANSSSISSQTQAQDGANIVQALEFGDSSVTNGDHNDRLHESIDLRNKPMSKSNSHNSSNSLPETSQSVHDLSNEQHQLSTEAPASSDSSLSSSRLAGSFEPTFLDETDLALDANAQLAAYYRSDSDSQPESSLSAMAESDERVNAALNALEDSKKESFEDIPDERTSSSHDVEHLEVVNVSPKSTDTTITHAPRASVYADGDGLP